MSKLKLNYVMIAIVIAVVLFGAIYFMKEKFAVMAYNPNIIITPTPSPAEQTLINKIVNDVESCFNQNYTTVLSTTDLNNFTNEFRTKWRELILTNIKNKVYYNDVLNFGDATLPESLMKKYYQNVIQTLITNYCNQTSGNYYNFDSFYSTQMSKIVDDLECLIKKLKMIIDGSSSNQITVDKQELLYQVKCIQNFVYNGLSNTFADPLIFYEELYNIALKSAFNNGYNFCEAKVKDVDYNSTKIVRLNAPLKKPNTTVNCVDLSSSFIRPTTIINPSGIIVKGGTVPSPSPSSSPSSTTRPSPSPSPSASATTRPSPSSSPSPSASPSPSSTTSTSASPSPSATTSTSASPSSSSSSGSGSVTSSITTPSPTSSSSSNSPQTVPYVASLASMPTAYNDTSNLGIEPSNMEDYELLASNQYFPIQPDINLTDAKGPNNFFIPNIWIEEYKN
jgi:hypothetical protein